MQTRFPLNQADAVLYENAKMDLYTKVEKQIQQVMFRTKCKWYEEGERNSKYFYSLEHAKYNAKTCQVLLYDDKILTTDEDILKAQHKFYSDLYRRDPEVNFTLQNDSTVRCSD